MVLSFKKENVNKCTNAWQRGYRQNSACTGSKVRRKRRKRGLRKFCNKENKKIRLAQHRSMEAISFAFCLVFISEPLLKMKK